MLDVPVIQEPATAAASLDPIRARILAALAEPGSAVMPTACPGLPRQKVNDHLKELGRMPRRRTCRRWTDWTERWSGRTTSASRSAPPTGLLC
ncbi:hypothetical protein [Streptomyces mirabilis]|uniref:hypothetical protein n=1 Tax=Streptomyces mirabilis TaxID=68239 RepID=UPI0033AF3AFE